jgi:hypothetical protein
MKLCSETSCPSCGPSGAELVGTWAELVGQVRVGRVGDGPSWTHIPFLNPEHRGQDCVSGLKKIMKLKFLGIKSIWIVIGGCTNSLLLKCYEYWREVNQDYFRNWKINHKHMSCKSIQSSNAMPMVMDLAKYQLSDGSPLISMVSIFHRWKCKIPSKYTYIFLKSMISGLRRINMWARLVTNQWQC